MSNASSSESSLLDSGTQEKNSETKARKRKIEMQRDDERNLQCNLAKNICPVALRNWPIFNLLEPDLISKIHKAMVYGFGSKVIFMTKDKNVYNLSINCNKNTNSEIGDVSTVFYPRKIEELCGAYIKTFAYGSYFLLALTENGEVYFWEFAEHKFSDGHISLTSTPTLVAELTKEYIMDIACGSHHFLALTIDGKVYAWGQNNCGQTGNEDIAIYNGNILRQVKDVLENKNVVHIACGSNFNMVLTDEGKLYGWGNNEDGQISIDNTTLPVTTQSNLFNPAENSIKSLHVSDSKDATLNSETSSNVQLQKHYVYPHEITTISDKIVKVACGWKHTLALTDKGKVYAWGKNDSGQIGVGNKSKFSGSNMVNVPVMVVDIAAYGDSSVAVGSNRIIYVWGNCFSQLITTPFPTTFSKIHDAFAYNDHKVMHKPLTVSTEDGEYTKGGLVILESLEASFDDPSTSDLTIQVEREPIHVHKVILQIRSQYFRNKFQRDSTDTDDGSTPYSATVYTAPNEYSYFVYKAFLKYLYTGTVDVPLENVFELIKLASAYCETSFEEDCIQIIKQAVTSSNVISIYIKAVDYKIKDLEEFCFKFVLRHVQAVALSGGAKKLIKFIPPNFVLRAAEEDVFKS